MFGIIVCFWIYGYNIETFSKNSIFEADVDENNLYRIVLQCDTNS